MAWLYDFDATSSRRRPAAGPGDGSETRFDLFTATLLVVTAGPDGGRTLTFLADRAETRVHDRRGATAEVRTDDRLSAVTVHLPAPADTDSGYPTPTERDRLLRHWLSSGRRLRVSATLHPGPSRPAGTVRALHARAADPTELDGVVDYYAGGR